MAMTDLRQKLMSYGTHFLFFFLVAAVAICLSEEDLMAAPEYGVPSSDIGTFQTPLGNWTFWIGWDATFSETYTPTNETYSWVVYFAPEGVYVALQSGKGLYSAINVNAGLDYFYGGLNLSTSTRLQSSMFNNLHSVTISKNAFDVTGGIPGTGPFSQLSFAISSGITVLKEKSTGRLLRGFQQSYGLSLALDLISLPLPLSVCLGIDTDADDPPELGKFVGFYPVIIWDVPTDTSENPLNLLASKMENDISEVPSSYPGPNYTKQTEQLLLKAVHIMQSSSDFNAFVESTAHNSVIDNTISGLQDWLDNRDTSHVDLPQILYPPDPRSLAEMKKILAATQMTFETAYTRPNQTHTIYVDCVKTIHCTIGEACQIMVPVQEISDQIPGVDDSELEGLWVGFDTTPEGFITHDKIEWQQVTNGAAVYTFIQNTDTPVILGISVNRQDLPQNIRNIQDKNLELCRRYVVFVGDVSGDGNINIVDALFIARFAVGLDVISFDEDAADVDCNDQVNIIDALLVARKAVGLPAVGWCKD